MSREIIRIGVYWLPPLLLTQALEQAWRGDLARKYKDLADHCEDKDQREIFRLWHKVCDLVHRHCGECPIWGAHATVLDAICILADDRDAFVQAMREVATKFLPIMMKKPEIKEWHWGDNVFLRWENGNGSGIQEFKRFRVAIAKEAAKFMVVEQVSWESVNNMERLLMAQNPLVRRKFQKAFVDLKALALNTLRLPHAPNVGLDWYIDRIASGGSLHDGELPFGPSPHISVASGICADDKYWMSAEQVGKFIKDHLKEVPEFAGLLADAADKVHSVDSVHIVEPAPTYIPPVEVTVVDRATGQARIESRQPWCAKEELISGRKREKNITLVWGHGPKETQHDLVKVVAAVSGRIKDLLKNDPRFGGIVFDEYTERQIHATIIGMEAAKSLSE